MQLKRIAIRRKSTIICQSLFFIGGCCFAFARADSVGTSSPLWSLWRSGSACPGQCPVSEQHTSAMVFVGPLTSATGNVSVHVIPFVDLDDNSDGGNGYGFYHVYIGGTRITSGVPGVVSFSDASTDGEFRKTTGFHPSECCFTTQNDATIVIQAPFFNSRLGTFGAGASQLAVEMVLPSTANVPCAAASNSCANMDDGFHRVEVTWTPAPPCVPSQCPQGNDCQYGDCVSGSCALLNDANGTSCTADSNPCTNDICNGSGTCTHPSSSNGTSCTSDGNPCTNDVCNGIGSCTHPNNTLPCNDGKACTVTDVCSGGTCQPGTPLVCNDNKPCTDDTCNPSTGCVYANDDTNSCSDGDACTGVEVCTAGTCQVTQFTDCNSNGVDDYCDVTLLGTSDDCNSNGVPDECEAGSPFPAMLIGCSIEHGRSFWRTQNNFLKLTFACDISAPVAGFDVHVSELLSGGQFGQEVGGSFAINLVIDANNWPRILKIRGEPDASLNHQKWYGLRSDPGWTEVMPFALHYVNMIGDASGDRFVTPLDVSQINASQGPQLEDSRFEIDGNGFTTPTDVSIANASQGAPPTKPSGHTATCQGCCPPP